MATGSVAASQRRENSKQNRTAHRVVRNRTEINQTFAMTTSRGRYLTDGIQSPANRSDGTSDKDR